MRKPVLPRIFILLLMYSIFFVAMVSIQFNKQDLPNQGTEESIFLSYFILPQGESQGALDLEINRWRDESYSLWGRTISGENNEDLVIAFLAESINRGNYRNALSGVSQSFLTGPRRTYGSSVYLGNMVQARISLGTLDQGRINRLAATFNEMSLDFLQEPGLLEFLSLRGLFDIIDAGAELLSSMDPAGYEGPALPGGPALPALDLIPGILEGYMDWMSFFPDRVNPFEGLLEGSLNTVYSSLRILDGQEDPDCPVTYYLPGLETRLSLVLFEDQADVEYNLRLGMALLACANHANDHTWAGVARSMIFSALTLSALEEDSALERAAFYRSLGLSPFLPRALAIPSPNINTWAWTAAEDLEYTFQNNVLEINVRFPVGETHYMIIRNIPYFPRIQLYNIDFRSDPQFEIYNSSGWVYNAQEQTMLVKMQHRSETETIRIFF